jgi:hypothetical protein
MPSHNGLIEFSWTQANCWMQLYIGYIKAQDIIDLKFSKKCDL